MSELLKAILLGIIQGATEFLPVSSSGHLVLVERFLGFENGGITFDLIVHFGSLIAVLLYFKKQWLSMARDVWRFLKTRRIETDSQKLFLLLATATVPAALIGALAESSLEQTRSMEVIAFTLVFGGVLFLVVERVARHVRDISSLKIGEAALIGFSQAVALIPGVSRSGITITSGMFLGLTREAAAQFSFMLSAPILLGGGVTKLSGLVSANGIPPVLLAGFIASLISSYLAVSFFLSLIRRHTLLPFAYYRFALAALLFGIMGVQR